MARLQVTLPVYLIVTKCDLISGFVEAFGGLAEKQRGQVWGVTLPLEAEPGERPQMFAERLDRLVDALEQRMMGRMRAEARGRRAPPPVRVPPAVRDPLPEPGGPGQRPVRREQLRRDAHPARGLFHQRHPGRPPHRSGGQGHRRADRHRAGAGLPAGAQGAQLLPQGRVPAGGLPRPEGGRSDPPGRAPGPPDRDRRGGGGLRGGGRHRADAGRGVQPEPCPGQRRAPVRRYAGRESGPGRGRAHGAGCPAGGPARAVERDPAPCARRALASA